jgi:hypothetical protein
MRRNLFFMAAAFAAVLLAGTACQKVGTLGANIPLLDSSKSIKITDGQTLQLPVYFLEYAGKQITGTAESSSEDYPVSFSAGTGNTGTLTISAPSLILDATPVNVTLTLKDESNSRTSVTNITVNPQISGRYRNITTPANTYVVDPGAVVDFPTNIGIGTQAASYDSFELLWQDTQSLVSKIMSSGNGKARVMLTEGKTGNALFAAKKNGEVVWSWLLWVTAGTGNVSWTNAEGQTFRVMDRNLGAFGITPGQTETNGLFFQWGRKDPFPGSAIDNTLKPIYDIDNAPVEIGHVDVDQLYMMDTAVKNPASFIGSSNNNAGNWSWISNAAMETDYNVVGDYWGGLSGKKTNYDPCPAGYKVASTDALGFVIIADYAKTRLFNSAVETPAAKDQIGMEIAVGGAKLFFPSQGDYAASTGKFEYGVGSTFPYLGFWTANFNPNFEAGTSKNYFQGMSIRTGANAKPDATASYTKFSGLTLSYGLPVRCVKE